MCFDAICYFLWLDFVAIFCRNKCSFDKFISNACFKKEPLYGSKKIGATVEFTINIIVFQSRPFSLLKSTV